MPCQLVGKRALTRTDITRNGEVLDVLHRGNILLQVFRASQSNLKPHRNIASG